MWKIVAAKKDFYCSKEHTARPRTASRREPRITSCWPLFLSGNKNKPSKRGKKKFLSVSLSLSFSRFSVSEDTSSCSFRSLERPQTRRNNNKEQKQAHEKSGSSLSLSLSLCALLLLPRLLGNPRLGNGDWYTWEERNERPLNPSQV